MRSVKIQQLIVKAKQRMNACRDPLHAYDHVERVVQNVKLLSHEYRLNQQQRQALILAAWWHDVSRAMTKRPSLIWMPLLDDLISACMLWKETIRCGLFGSVVGMSTRLIFCKSLGTGTILTRVFLRKKNRILLDILKDADTLDILHLHRLERVYTLVETSQLYAIGYQINIWWFLTTTHLHMKTEAARKYIEQAIREFMAWAEQRHVIEWHARHFGTAWVEKNTARCEALIQHLHVLNGAFRSVS